MKRPAVSYRDFHLRRINEPQFSHLKLLFGWVVYFALYFLTENGIPAARCYSVWCPLDDIIPFCEWFVIPYVGWYGLIVWSLGHFLRYDISSFKKLQIYIMITQAVAMLAYILFPTRQDLRPEVFANDNVLTRLTGLIYTLDTNTGVCPSLHVAYSLGIASTWLRQKEEPRWKKAAVVIFVVLVCLSTMFLKQHSAVDVLAAVPVCLLAEWLVFIRPKKPPL